MNVKIYGKILSKSMNKFKYHSVQCFTLLLCQHVFVKLNDIKIFPNYTLNTALPKPNNILYAYRPDILSPVLTRCRVEFMDNTAMLGGQSAYFGIKLITSCMDLDQLVQVLSRTRWNTHLGRMTNTFL